MRGWAFAALLTFCETAAVALHRDHDGLHHERHHKFINERMEPSFPPMGMGPVQLSPRMRPAFPEQPPAEEGAEGVPQSMIGNWPSHVGPAMPAGPLSHLVQDVQAKCGDDFQRLCEWQHPLIELGFERMVLDLAKEPKAVEAEGVAAETVVAVIGVPAFVVPLGFGSRSADACMRANLAQVSEECRQAVTELDASKPPIMPDAPDMGFAAPHTPLDQEQDMLPPPPMVMFPPPPPFPMEHMPGGEEGPSEEGGGMPPEPFHFHARGPAMEGEQQPDMAMWPLHHFVPLPQDLPLQQQQQQPPQPPRMRGGRGQQPRPGMHGPMTGPMQQQPPPDPRMGGGLFPFHPMPMGGQDGHGPPMKPPQPGVWVRGNGGDAPGPDDEDEEDAGAGMLAVGVALLMWLGLSILIIVGFVRAEKRRETLLQFWRTIHGNHDLKNAVEQAAGLELPAPPKGCGLRKFIRAVVIALFVVITLQISLGICHGPPPSDGPPAVTPTDGGMPDGNGDDFDEDGRPHPALAFMLLMVMVLTSAFLVKSLVSFCRRTTASPSTTTNTATAPSSIQHGGVAYEAVPTMEMGAGTTSYVAFDSPRRQVYVGVPVSAPPPNTHAVPPQSAPGMAMVL